MEFRQHLLLLCLSTLAACQSSSSYAASSSSIPASSSVSSYAPGVTHTLPPPPEYEDGVFINPDTATTQVFSVGSTMNVSWTTDYPSVNLYLIYGGNYAEPTTILSGSTRTWVEWRVEADPDNELPFSFRAVNAEGTTEDQTAGGFYTGQFWLSEPDTSSSTSENTKSYTKTTLGAATSTPTNGATPTSNTSSIPTGNNDDDDSSVAIGAGVGVGVGAVLLLAGAGAWFFIYRRRKQRKQQEQAPQGYQGVSQQGPPSSYQDSQSTSHWVNNQQHWQSPPMSQQQHGYYAGSPPPVKSPPSEIGQPHYFVEAPGNQVEPREMDGGYYGPPKPPSR